MDQLNSNLSNLPLYMDQLYSSNEFVKSIKSSLQIQLIFFYLNRGLDPIVPCIFQFLSKAGFLFLLLGEFYFFYNLLFTRLKDFPDDDPSCERNVNLQKEGKLLVKVTTSKTNDLNASTVQQHRTIFYLSHKFTPMCSTVWSSHKSSIALTIPKNTKQTNVGLCV